MAENKDWYNFGQDVGSNGGSMPTYQAIRDQHGQTAANWAYDGYRTGQTQGQPGGNTSSNK